MNVRYELAKGMIADRQREAALSRTAREAQEAQRAERASGRAPSRSGGTISSRMRSLLRSRTA